MNEKAKKYILPIQSVNARNGLLTIGDTVRFEGCDDRAKIEGFGVYNNIIFIAFDNEEFGEHPIEAEDIFKV